MRFSSMLTNFHALNFRLKIARFEIFLLFAVFMLLYMPQGQDLIKAFSEDMITPSFNSLFKLLFFDLVILIWSYSTWHWVRTLYRFSYPLEPYSSDFTQWLVCFLPRILGILPNIIILLAFKKADLLFTSLGLHVFLVGLAFFLFVWQRRNIKSLRPYIKSSMEDRFESINKLDQLTINISLAALGLGTLCFILATFMPEKITFLPNGAIFLLMLWGATWAPFAALIAYFSNIYRLPALFFIFGIAFLVSVLGTNDNHKLRVINSPFSDTRMNLTKSYDEWKHRNPKEGTPLIIVATEGGGIRAAYWTATVLGRLQDLNSEFRNQLFAISGVSGGSVGATVFRSLLAEDNGTHKTFDFETIGQNALKRDFLGPPTASMLWPDMFQRFVPLVLFKDRAEALEKGFEESYLDSLNESEQNKINPIKIGKLSQSFMALSQNGPALLLNATSTKDGARVIASTIKLNDQDGKRDLLSIYQHDIPASSAAAASARFPLVSPAASIYVKCKNNSECSMFDTRLEDRLVDGGYFENFGATTATELYDAIRELASNRKIIVIQITSDPSIDENLRNGNSSDISWPAPESTSPIKAVMAAREQHGQAAALLLCQKAMGSKTCNPEAAPDQSYYHFRMCQANKEDKNSHEPPLGWTLSGRSRNDIQDYLPKSDTPDHPDSCGNFKQLEQLVKQLESKKV